MKIIFLNHFISEGGAERVTSLLSGKMVEKGHEVVLITDLYKPFAYSFNKRIKRIPLFNTESEVNSHVSLFYMIRNTRKALKVEKPDVIIGVMPLMNLVAVCAAWGLKTKVITSDHTSFERKLPIHIHLIRKYAYRLADQVTVLTQADFNFLGKELPQKRVMPNPLAYQCVDEVGVNRKKMVLAAGRLDDWKVKGFDLLIKAWASVAEDFPEWSLNIAGGGSNNSKAQLLQIAEDLNISNRVAFLGFRHDLDAVMRESSIFVLSSRVEGFGMVLIEAMSQGCACITFDDGGRQREIITSNQEGCVIEDHDVSKLAEALKLLISDEDRLISIASASVKRASDYSLEVIENRWEELLTELVKNEN